MSGKKIIENLQLVKGWELRHDDFTPMLSSCVVAANDSRPGIKLGDTEQERYRLSATVGIDFWANRAQLPSATEIAIRTFAKRMYGDINGMVYEIMSEISNGDREAAMKACALILDYTTGAR
jgi:NOL1/NOP2/fmu family ribosome biogenesis protein